MNQGPFLARACIGLCAWILFCKTSCGEPHSFWTPRYKGLIKVERRLEECRAYGPSEGSV